MVDGVDKDEGEKEIDPSYTRYWVLVCFFLVGLCTWAFEISLSTAGPGSFGSQADSRAARAGELTS